MQERSVHAIEYSDTFLRHLSRLPKRIIERAEEREKIFKADVYDSRLRTHKLHGKDKDHWAFWVDYRYRIKFIFFEEGQALFLDIGTHNDVY